MHFLRNRYSDLVNVFILNPPSCMTYASTQIIPIFDQILNCSQLLYLSILSACFSSSTFPLAPARSMISISRIKKMFHWVGHSYFTGIWYANVAANNYGRSAGGWRGLFSSPSGDAEPASSADAGGRGTDRPGLLRVLHTSAEDQSDQPGSRDHSLVHRSSASNQTSKVAQEIKNVKIKPIVDLTDHFPTRPRTFLNHLKK